MDLASETLNYSNFDIQYEFFPRDNCLYDFDSKENEKLFQDVDSSTVFFDSGFGDEQFRQSNYFETNHVSAAIYGNCDNAKCLKVESNKQYYAHRTSQFIQNDFQSGMNPAHDGSTPPLQDPFSSCTNSRIFVCPYCNKNFTSEKYLSMHVSLHNVPNASGESNSVQLIVEEFKNHGICPIERSKARGGNKSASWTCKICMKTFAQNSNYKNHIRTHSNERPFVCNICSIGFKERYHLKKHILFVHTSEMKEKCKFCGKKFKDSTAVRAHEKTHSDLRPYICSRCNKAFKTSECLWHHENRSKACVKLFLKNNQSTDLKVDSKSTKPGSSMEQHQETQLCRLDLNKEANPTFYDSSLQDSHNSVKVENISNYCANPSTSNSTDVVQYYSQISAISSSLGQREDSLYKVNSVSPSGYDGAEQNNLVCTHCDKQFISLAAFKKHASIHSSNRPFQCDECSVGFKLKVHLKKHNLYKHTDKYLCECGICGKRFKDSSAVKLHERTHSEERPFLCQCGKSFKTRENLWGHQHRGPCESSYEMSGLNGLGGTDNWQSNNGEYLKGDNKLTNSEPSSIPSQEVIPTSNSFSNTSLKSQQRETSRVPRMNDNWRLVVDDSRQFVGQAGSEQHSVIPTAIVVPMKRIPSSIFSQNVMFPLKNAVDAAFLPPFESFKSETFCDVTANDALLPIQSNSDTSQFNISSKFQQKLPDIQCMLQSFSPSLNASGRPYPNSFSCQMNALEFEFLPESKGSVPGGSYQMNPLFAAQTTNRDGGLIQDGQFSIHQGF